MGVLGSLSFGQGSRGALGLAAILFASLLAAMPAGALIDDGGFESGVLGGPDDPPMDLSFGMWTARDTNSRLAMAPEPVHTGSWSAAVDTRTSSIGSFIIQDIDSGSASYRWTFWVHPVQGIDGAVLIYGWDRGVAGVSQLGSAVGFSPGALAFVGWNAPPVTFPPLTSNAWHEILVVANRCTLVQHLFVDGVLLGSVQATGTAPSGVGTIIFGDGSFVANHGFYFYDDFAFQPFDCAEQPPCPRSHGFWKNHADGWPVTSLVLGDEAYGADELLALLRAPSRGDATLILAHQLIAAKLNVANGTDDGPVHGAITDAVAALAPFAGRLPYDVRASSVEGQLMVALAEILDDFNEGELTPGCDCDDDSGDDDDDDDDDDEGDGDGEDDDDDGDSAAVEVASGAEHGIRLMNEAGDDEDDDDDAGDDDDDDDDDCGGDDDSGDGDDDDSGDDSGGAGNRQDEEGDGENTSDADTPRTIREGGPNGAGSPGADSQGAPGAVLRVLTPWAFAAVAGLVAGQRVVHTRRSHR